MSLEFWQKVEKTNPKYTKDASVSGQKRTAVDAQYKKKMITEQFGMYGLGWGVIPGSEEYDRIYYEQTCLLNYRATAFYVYKGQRAELPIAAQIKESYVTNGGKGYLKVDDEAVKKVRTDALTKAFTDLGFCADIHMGMFDDQDYVQGARALANMKEAEEREAKQTEEYNNIKDWIADQVEAARTVKSDQQFIKAIDRIKEKAIMRCAVAGFTSKGFETRLDEIKQERNNASK